MASVPAYTGKQVESALLKKGFKHANKGHKFLTLFIEGRKTAIRTMVSHGKKTYKGSLEKSLRDQLKVTKEELVGLVECPLSMEAYLECLKKRKAI